MGPADPVDQSTLTGKLLTVHADSAPWPHQSASADWAVDPVNWAPLSATHEHLWVHFCVPIAFSV